MLKRTLIILNNEEINVLNKIARKTKMDCWFRLELNNIDNVNSGYVVYDSENNITLDIDEALMDIVDGLDCQENWDNCCLTEEEKNIFRVLCYQLNVNFNY